MTGNNVLLDTSVVIELFKGNPIVLRQIESYDSIYISFAVLGELHLGVYRSTNRVKHLKEVTDFLNNCTVLDADILTTEHYAIIKASLLIKGKPIPENDIWIAANARQHQLKLITRDRHFELIDNLLLEQL